MIQASRANSKSLLLDFTSEIRIILLCIEERFAYKEGLHVGDVELLVTYKWTKVDLNTYR